MESEESQRRPADLAAAIRERLREYVRDYYDDNQSHFARSVEVPRTTVTGWFSTEPHAPNIPQLVALATNGNINLNWLLFGELPRLRTQQHPTEETFERLRAAVVAELAAEFATEAVEKVVPRPDELFKIVLDECRNWAQVSGRIVGLGVTTAKDGREKIRLFVEPGPQPYPIRGES